MNEIRMNQEIKDIAKSEIKRRGTILVYEIEISPHAIDRASIYWMKAWSKKDQI